MKKELSKFQECFFLHMLILTLVQEVDGAGEKTANFLLSRRSEGFFVELK